MRNPRLDPMSSSSTLMITATPILAFTESIVTLKRRIWTRTLGSSVKFMYQHCSAGTLARISDHGQECPYYRSLRAEFSSCCPTGRHCRCGSKAHHQRASCGSWENSCPSHPATSFELGDGFFVVQSNLHRGIVPSVPNGERTRVLRQVSPQASIG